MTLCEMCGKNGSLFRTKVEGSELLLCNNCSGYGNKLGGRPNSIKFLKNFSDSNDKIVRASNKYIHNQDLELVSDFCQKIQRSRSKRNMTQEQFANLLKERVSVIQKWESGQLKPRIEIAKKLERSLNLTLIRKIGSENNSENSNDTKEDQNDSFVSKNIKKGADGFTLGDFVKVRVRK